MLCSQTVSGMVTFMMLQVVKIVGGKKGKIDTTLELIDQKCGLNKSSVLPGLKVFQGQVITMPVD